MSALLLVAASQQSKIKHKQLKAKNSNDLNRTTTSSTASSSSNLSTNSSNKSSYSTSFSSKSSSEIYHSQNHSFTKHEIIHDVEDGQPTIGQPTVGSIQKSEPHLSNNHQFFKVKTNSTTSNNSHTSQNLHTLQNINSNNTAIFESKDDFNEYECSILKYSWYLSIELPHNINKLKEIKEFRDNKELIEKINSKKYENKNGNFYINVNEINNIEKLFNNKQFWNNIYQELKFLNLEIFNKLPNLTEFSNQFTLIFKFSIESLPNLSANLITIEYLNKIGNLYERIYDLTESNINEFLILILNNLKDWFGKKISIEILLIWEHLINKILRLIFNKSMSENNNHEFNNSNSSFNNLIEKGNNHAEESHNLNGVADGGENYIREFEQLKLDHSPPLSHQSGFFHSNSNSNAREQQKKSTPLFKSSYMSEADYMADLKAPVSIPEIKRKDSVVSQNSVKSSTQADSKPTPTKKKKFKFGW